jgi:hypothetical protein
VLRLAVGRCLYIVYEVTRQHLHSQHLRTRLNSPHVNTCPPICDLTLAAGWLAKMLLCNCDALTMWQHSLLP